MERQNKGFIQLIILIVIALVAAKYFFNWSIFEAAGTPEGKGTLAYLSDLFVWIKGAILALWSYIH